MHYTHGFARSGTSDIYYEETGNGQPVVFCHAGVSDRRLWDPQFGSPVPGFRYIRSDMRGFGNTDWVPEPYKPHQDIRAVIDHLGLEDLFLVGCSMGGKATLELAAELGNRVGKIMVAGCGLPGWEPADGGYTPPQWAGLDPLWENEDWDAIVKVDAEVWGVGVGRDWSDVQPGFLTKMMEMDLKPVMTEEQREDHMSWMEPPIDERLDEIKATTTVVVGEHDLPDVVESTKHLSARLGGTRVVIPGTAHLPSLEVPDRFNPLLEEFLRDIGG